MLRAVLDPNFENHLFIFITPMIAQAEIRQLTLHEKLALLEAVWCELAVDPDTIEVPRWHADILDDRQRTLDQGSSQVLDWDAAKEQIHQMTR